jgi:HTH-type transcriptional regulator/antitoxin HigA
MANEVEPIRYAVPPGRLIRKELAARGWSQQKLAAKMKRPYQAVNEIINERKAITADTAIDLGRAFGTSAKLWMNLQAAYELYQAAARRKERVKSVR